MFGQVHKQSHTWKLHHSVSLFLLITSTCSPYFTLSFSVCGHILFAPVLAPLLPFPRCACCYFPPADNVP